MEVHKGAMVMEFIKPKSPKQKLSLSLSKRTIDVLNWYSKYNNYSIDDIVDKFMLNIKNDEDFIEWVLKQRNNKKILDLVQGSESGEDDLGELNGEAEETDREF